MHSGIITNGEMQQIRQYVKSAETGDRTTGIGLMTKVAGSTFKYQIKITPKSYGLCSGKCKLNRIGMVFRNADGTKEGKASGGNDIL
jgi:hypothetical protein